MTVLLLVFGVVLMVAALPVVWLASRRNRRRVFRVAFGASAVVLFAIGACGVGIYLWALTATDSSQFARAIIWGDSSYGDQDRFPARTVEASTDPAVFQNADEPKVAEFVSRVAEGLPLDEFLAATDTTAFIVLHGDQLLYEGYFNESGHDATQTSFSVAKSFTATLIGIAIEEGFIADLDQSVTRYLPELVQRDRRFSDITLRHLITMSSGLSFRDGSSPWADPANTYHGTNLRSAAIFRPTIDQPPGEVFHYNDWNVILLGLVLERTTEMPVSEYFETRLWQPMGAEADGSWSLDSDSAGFEKMFVGINGRAIDFARFGWLYLNNGNNGTQQVVPSDFIAEATRAETTTDPASNYQYLWWIDEERASFYANGDHCQNIYVDPAASLVVVRHGTDCANIDWIQLIGELADWLQRRLTET